MKYNYMIIVHYDGTDYKGWQFQAKGTPTIQGELVRVLMIIAKKKVTVTGSSRTDAGVHSTGLTANFHIPVNIAPESMKKALNSLLPRDIRIAECRIMDRSFNARFGARSKTYIYKIYHGQVASPFTSRYMHHIPYPLDKRAMKKALKYFKGEHNFSSFTSDEPEKNRIRTIKRCKMKTKGDEIIFTIKGKSFLRYMVRNIVGTIIDVGRGKLLPDDIPNIFAARDRRRAGQTAPAKGLTLEKVEY